MDEEGDFMAYSRVKKYQELRDGIKEEAGIDREKVVDHIIDDEDDDFLSFIKKDVEFQKPQNIEDTLTEPKTFEQMRQEGSKELEEALRDAKKGVGKDNPYNTRMDILSKIRDGEKTTIKIDSVDEYSTDEFARGMFLNEKKDIQHPEQEETVKEDEPKKKMTLMEKLASISPEEDARKAQEFLQEEMEKENNEDLQFEEPESVVDEEPQEETVEIEKVLEETKEYQQIENDDQLQRTDKERKEEKVKKDGKIVKVLDIIITVLVMILIVLLCIIIYQNFF